MPVATTAQIDADGRFKVENMPLRRFTANEVSRYVCSPGDILVVKSSGSAANIISGKAGIVDINTSRFVFSNFLMRLRTDKNVCLPEYVYALLVSHLTRERIKLMCSTTTFPNLKIGEYMSAGLPVPPLEEQIAISESIKINVTAINQAILSQQKMIELLKERRLAVIVQAATKGLDHKARMKESGLPWLGRIPAHWNLLKVSHIGFEVGVKNEGMVEDNLLSLSYGRIIRKDIDANEGLLPASFEGYQIVEEGDTVLRLTDLQNDQKSLRAGYVNERGIITSAYCAVRPTAVSPRWLFNALRSSDMLKVFYSMGGGVRQSLDFESVKRILIPVPPRAEQLAIDAYLIAEEARIRSAISSQERMIELLKERRSAIITQAVTGQIDVR